MEAEPAWLLDDLASPFLTLVGGTGSSEDDYDGLTADDLPPTFHDLYPHCSSFGWWTMAACRVGKLVRGMYPEERAALFHPNRGSTKDQIAEAKAVCASCPVQMECLDYALEANETRGIWGGLGAKERRPLARERKLAKAKLRLVLGDGG